MQSSQVQGAQQSQETSEASSAPDPPICASFQFNAAAPDFVPSRPPIAALPEHLQDLHTLWDQHAHVEENEARKSSVQTWFLSPGRQRLRCGYCRKVHLYDDYMQWEDAMRQAWADEIRSDQPVFFFVVQPTPIALAPDIAAHVLIVQDVTAHQVASLVTIFDVAMHQGHPFRIAIVTHEHITREEILERIGYTAEVARLGPLIQCTFRHGAFTMPIGRAVPGRDGDHTVVTISRSHIEEDWMPPFLPVAPGMEGLHFLQHTAHKKESDTNSDTNNVHSKVVLDFKEVFGALTWFDTHFSLPVFDIEVQLTGQVNLHPQSLEWIRSDWFACDAPVDAIKIYYDGSFMPHNRAIGFAAAAFVCVAHEWRFAGALSGHETCECEQGSYRAEVLAATIAAKFLFDLCKVETEVFSCRPNCELVFDSLTVGRQTEGKWKATKAIEECHLLRSIMRLCECRFQVKV